MCRIRQKLLKKLLNECIFKKTNIIVFYLPIVFYYLKTEKEFYMKYFYLFVAGLITLALCGCNTMLPAEDIKIFEVCKDEIAVLKNPKLRPGSKEKYEAALSLTKKVDFSYTRTIKFLGKVFLDADARVNDQGDGKMTIIMYYPYEDRFVSFEFFRYNDHILKSSIKYK